MIPEGTPFLLDDDLLFEDGPSAPSSWENYARAVKEWAEFLAEHGVGLFDTRERLKA